MPGTSRHIFCALALCGALVGASPGAAPPGDRPASPRSLPSDELPPFGMLDEGGKLIPVPVLPAPPRAGSTDAGGPPVPPAAPPGVTPGPAIDAAIEGARAALNACLARGAKVAVVVVDLKGRPRAALMAEGSEGSIFVAMRKAVATLVFRAPSSEIAARLAQDPALRARITPVMFLAGGALPLFRDGQLIGAIASSGAHGAGPIGAEDELCARAGMQKINERMVDHGK